MISPEINNLSTQEGTGNQLCLGQEVAATSCNSTRRLTKFWGTLPKDSLLQYLLKQ